MAIATTERADILELVALMFDAAPGAGILADLVSLYEGPAGRSLPALATILGNTGVFQTLHPNFESAQEFAADLLGGLGLAGDTAASDWVIAQYNAGASKASIIYAAWDFLDDLPATAPPQYVAARAIMENKAEVSEYYSVVLARSSASVAVLQDVLAGVTADPESVDAAIAELIEDAASGPVLTQGVDILAVPGSAATTVTGLVDGDADGSSADGTFNAGDRITGNGLTRIDVTVLEGGGTGFVRMDRIQSVDINAGTSGVVTFDASAWTNLGAVRLDGGIDGLHVRLDALQAGVDLAILGVAGTMEATYSLGGGELSAVLRQDAPGDASGTLRVEADGTVDIDLADGMAASLSTLTAITLADVSVQGDGSATFSAAWNGAPSVTVGDVDIEAGSDSVITLAVTDTVGATGFGRIGLALGDDSNAGIAFGEVASTLQVDDITFSAGDGSRFGLAALAPSDDGAADAAMSFGDIAVELGASGTFAASFDGGGGKFEAGSLTVGDLAAEGGASASFSVQVQDFDSAALGDVELLAGDASLVELEFAGVADGFAAGAITLAAGDESFLSIAGNVHGGMTLGAVSLASGDDASGAVVLTSVDGAIGLGKVSLQGGAAADLAFIAQAADGMAADDLALGAGNESQVRATLAVLGPGGSLAIGDVAIELGDASEADLVAVNSAEYVGTFAAGGVAAEAGNDSRIAVTYVHTALGSLPEGDAGVAAGNMTVGDVTLAVGSASSISAMAQANFTVFYGATGEDSGAGSLLIGDVWLSVGDGFVSGTLENEAQASFVGAAQGAAALGNVEIGTIRMDAGDFADLAVSVAGAVAGEDAGEGASLGHTRIGSVTIAAGEGADIAFDAHASADNSASIGDLEIGELMMEAAQDAVVAVDVRHGGEAEGAGALGDFSLARLEGRFGDNANVRVDIAQEAHHAAATLNADGEFSVGDIALAVCATTDADPAGTSRIAVEIGKHSTGLGTLAGRDFTVGDVTLSGGDAVEIDLDIVYSGSHDRMGEVSIGTVALHAGDDADALDATVTVRNHAAGDFDDIALGGFELVLGDDSSAAASVRLLHEGLAGDLADLDLGDLALDLGEGSNAGVSLLIAATTGASVGDFRVGNIAATLDEGAALNLEALDLDAASVGDVSIGAIDAALGIDASMDFGVDIVAAGRVGTVAAGDWALSLGAGASANPRLAMQAADVGAVTLGSLDFTLGAGSLAEDAGLWVTASGDIEGVAVGDLRASVQVGASARIVLHAEAGSSAGPMSVGDIHLDVLEPAEADPAAARAEAYVTLLGAEADTLSIGDITLDIGGDAAGDEAWVVIDASGDVVLGNLTVTGLGAFSFDMARAGDANTSLVAVSAGGSVTIGAVDFSGFEGDADLDLAWTLGASTITGGSGDDAITGNDSANVIAGGKGVDVIDLSEGGDDTIVTALGDSGPVAGTLDTLTGFSGGDRLDFGLVAGTAGNYVERSENFSTFAQFLSNAGLALNSNVRYFVQDNGTDTYVAVNYGSGEADVVIVLAGVGDATALQFANFVA